MLCFLRDIICVKWSLYVFTFSLIILALTACGQDNDPSKESKPVLSGMEIESDLDTVAKGLALAVSGRYSNGLEKDLTSEVRWHSRDESIAVVGNSGAEKGILSALEKGQVFIEAELNGLVATFSVTVVNEELVSVMLAPDNPTVERGDDITFSATGVYSDGSERDLSKDVSWQVESVKVADLNPNAVEPGTLTTINEGATKVIVEFSGHSVATLLTVAELRYRNTNIAVLNASTLGQFDPSLEYEPGGDVGWMAYTEVDFPYLNTHIAKSEDGGASWDFIAEINRGYAGVITDVYDQNRVKQGYWRNEVPSLVHHPADRGREWKLFWHHYFSIGTDRLFQYGWVGYKYASHPSGPWSEEVPIFGSTDMFPPLELYETEFRLHELDVELASYVVYTEPGALVYNDVLYLCLTAFSTPSSGRMPDIVLLSFSVETQTWSYLGKLLGPEDASDFGFDTFNAASLTQEQGRLFLLAAGYNVDGTHHGTYVFEIENVEFAQIKRDGQGDVVPVKYFPLSKGYINGGHSDYDEHNIQGGLVMPQTATEPLDNDFTNFWQLFDTERGIVD